MNSTNKEIDLYIENNLYKYLPSIFDTSAHQVETSKAVASHEIKEIKSQIYANIKRVFLSNRDKKLRYGDIIGIPRKPLLNLVPYDHYGVYINHDSVIHFSSKESDVNSLNNTIIETSLRIFTREDSGIFRLNFPDVYGKPTQIYVDETKLAFERSKYFIHDCVNNYFEKLKKYHLYGPSETVKRARSKLGAKGYNIITNNCEHFAIWCKTGLYESHQVEYYANLLSPFKTKLDGQNNAQRAYIPDPDLEFLKHVPNEDIDTLVNYLIKDKDGTLRMTELLTVSDDYKLHAPDHHQYLKEIAAELQCFGANSIATLFRGGKGVIYKKILCDVCDKMKVVYDKTLPTDVIEMHLMIKY